jgi:hypothetical protein
MDYLIFLNKDKLPSLILPHIRAAAGGYLTPGEINFIPD